MLNAIQMLEMAGQQILLSVSLVHCKACICHPEGHFAAPVHEQCAASPGELTLESDVMIVAYVLNMSLGEVGDCSRFLGR